MKSGNQNHTVLLYTDDNIDEQIKHLLQPYLTNNIPIYAILDHDMKIKIDSLFDTSVRGVIKYYENIRIYYENGQFDSKSCFANADQFAAKINNEQPSVVIGMMPLRLMTDKEKEDLIVYEEMINSVLSNYNSMFYCLYDINNMNAQNIHDLKEVHRYRIEKGQIQVNSDESYEYNNMETSTVCVKCYRTKDGAGNWYYLEPTGIPLSSNTISHGLCDDCLTIYP